MSFVCMALASFVGDNCNDANLTKLDSQLTSVTQ